MPKKYTESRRDPVTQEWVETTRDMTPLEEEFAELVKKTQKQIDAKVDEANKLLTQAGKLALKNGVAFYARCSQVSQAFCAPVLPKFEELDEQFIEDILGMSPTSEYSDEGWEHSGVC